MKISLYLRRGYGYIVSFSQIEHKRTAPVWIDLDGMGWRVTAPYCFCYFYEGQMNDTSTNDQHK